MTRAQWRARLVAVCLVMCALAFSQSPGLVAADTKLDLTQDPAAFLARALHLWDGQAFFGELQNQAYGYLFPMGPFFLVGDLLHLEPWVVQRLWWSVLLCTAFLGAVRLARLAGIQNPWARAAAGLAYVLAPRMVSTLGPISAEALPFALAPWVVVPLAAWRPGRSVRRAAAASGVAVLLMGGINATAAAAAALLGLLWIVTEAERGHRLRLAGAWLGCAALATAWFLGPLVILGRFSPPFLDWIESAAVTTSITDAGATLRGTTDWVAYLADRAGPQWPAGWQLLTERWMVAGTVLVAAAGASGFAWRGARHQRFALVSISLGVVFLVSAHVAPIGAASGPFAEQLRWLLDGALSPLRNVHKFDGLVRLPLALGVGFAVAGLSSALSRARSQERGARVRSSALAGTAVALVAVALVGAAGPVLAGSVTENRTFVAIPDYWEQAASWLRDDGGSGRALVVPGASFGLYVWGMPRDEPLQLLASTDWGVRDAVPLSSAGNIRALDAVEDLLARGRPDASLADHLARMGVTHLVVRNDLDPSRVDAPVPSIVHQAIDGSGGLQRVAFFGPFLRGGSTAGLAINGGIDGGYPALEVYAVRSAQTYERAVVRDAESPYVLQGESEALLGASAIPGIGGRTVVRAGDADALDGEGLMTDSGRRTEVDFGRVHDNRSSLLVPTAPWTLDRRVHDYVVAPPLPGPTTEPEGEWQLRASTSRGDAASVRLDPSSGPWNAVDGVAGTAWFPRTFAGSGQWWEALAPQTFGVGGATLRLASDPPGTPGSATLVVETDKGSRDVELDLPADSVRIPDDLLPTTRLRVTFARTEPSTVLLGISELESSATPVARGSAVPEGPAATAALVLRARDTSAAACVPRRPTNCWPPLLREAEESSLDRTVTTGGLAGPVVVTANPRPGIALDKLLLPAGEGALAEASSQRLSDPQVRAQAGIDRDPWTSWQASPLDDDPTFTVQLVRPTRVSYVRVLESAGLAASRPLAVDVVVGGRTYSSISDQDGFIRFPATRTASIELRIRSTVPMLAYDTELQTRTVLPVGISDLVLGEADAQRVGIEEDAQVSLPCGFGPTVSVAGAPDVLTSVTTTVGALLAGGPVTATSCRGSTLAAGTSRISVKPTGELVPTGLVWPSTSSAAGPSTPGLPRVVAWEPTARSVLVEASERRRTLETGENFNPGWVATLGGVALEPVRVDGWRQGFVLPRGAGGLVDLVYAPDRAYRLLLGLGAVLALALLVLAIWPAGKPADMRRHAVRRAAPRWLWPLAAVSAMGLACGPMGALGAAIGVVIARRPEHRPVWAAAAAIVGAGAAVVQPWPAYADLAGAAEAAVAASGAVGLGAVLGVLARAAADADGRVARRGVTPGGPPVAPVAPPAST